MPTLQKKNCCWARNRWRVAHSFTIFHQPSSLRSDYSHDIFWHEFLCLQVRFVPGRHWLWQFPLFRQKLFKRCLYTSRWQKLVRLTGKWQAAIRTLSGSAALWTNSRLSWSPGYAAMERDDTLTSRFQTAPMSCWETVAWISRGGAFSYFCTVAECYFTSTQSSKNLGIDYVENRKIWLFHRLSAAQIFKVSTLQGWLK